ncbi:MAG: SH3 domain-containing protein [Candidatus Flexifilum sp.]|jgi:hypothetical protein
MACVKPLVRALMRALALGLLLFAAACNLTTGPNTGAGSTQTPTDRPVVLINSPANGAEFTVNQQILVSATATDSVGVSRVQLLANGVVVKTINSESPTGDRTFNALLDYLPRTAGQVQLQVIAYRGAVASTPSAITVSVRDSQQFVTATAAPPQQFTSVPPINPNDPTCRVLTNANVNLRQGPGTNYPVLTLLTAGTVAPVTGRIGSNQWYQVRVGTTLGWVSAGYVTLYGTLCSTVPLVPTPPPPSPSAQPTIPVTPPTATPIPPTATPVPPTATPGLPDLLITSVNGPATLTLGPGNTPVSAAFTVTITNNGGRPTGQFNNTITVSPGSTSSDLGVVGNLNPGESVILSVSLTFTAAGTYTLQAQADSSAQVTEASEVNNLGFGSVIVSSAP